MTDPVGRFELQDFFMDMLHEARQSDPDAGIFPIITDERLAAYLAEVLSSEFVITQKPT